MDADDPHDPRLTIGEVLTVLREDFPDVSISKIRYLESEDLVHPQRTPSGYRKFSSADVARLRYVLAAQRDQYLDRKSTRLNSSHANISYAVFCLKKKKQNTITIDAPCC